MQQEWLLAMFIENLEGRPKVGVIADVGNRREEDNIDMGYPASEMFDEIIILSEADTLCEFSTMISLTWDSGITMVAVASSPAENRDNIHPGSC